MPTLIAMPALLIAMSALVAPLHHHLWSHVMKRYRGSSPEQSYLLPPSALDWLPEGHLAYFILDLVKQLDLRAITQVVQAGDARGERPYSPQMMTALLLYAYCTGVFSSRRIARATYEDVAIRVIASNEHPHFTRIAAFRRQHMAAFADIFVQSVKLCAKAGLVKLGVLALDGTKMQANASKHKAMSYERMQLDEKRLTDEIAQLLARAEAADQNEDRKHGEGQDDEDLPAELRRREDRFAKIKAAKEALEREAARARVAQLQAQAERHEQRAAQEPDTTDGRRAATLAGKRREQAAEIERRIDDDQDPPTSGASPSGLATHRAKSLEDGTPTPGAQYNFTDPQSRILEQGGGFVQGYNSHVAVDGRAQVIVAQGVTNLQADNPQLQPMLEQTWRNVGRPEVVVADTGFWSPGNAQLGDELGITLLIAVGRIPHGAPSTPPPSRPDDTLQDHRTLMRAKLNSPNGRALYARRKAIVEPVFGQVKAARGFRQFLMRGIKKVAAEWSLITATHNLLKLYRYGLAPTT